MLDYASPQPRRRLWRRTILAVQAIITLLVIGAVISVARRPATQMNSDASAALSLLLRTPDITSEAFSCPTTQPSEWEWDFGGGANTAVNWSNWNSSAGVLKNLSYSYQNPYPNSATNVSSGK
jgi:hypothetical protein